MAYNLEEGLPWHGFGNGVEGAMTAEQAITKSGLDWLVELVPLYVLIDDKPVLVPDRYGVQRSTDGKVLGIVAKDYKTIQNVQAFDFFDTLVDNGDAKYQTAGALAGGKRVWLTAHVGEDIMVAGQDPHRMYLLLVTSHDGSKSLTAATTMIRVVCSNTETMALKAAKTSWTMTHRSELEGKVSEAREALKLSFKYRDAFEKEVEKLLSIEVTVDQFRKVMDDVLPAQPRSKPKNLDTLTTLFQESPTIVDAGLGGNAWGAFNATTEWLTHHREVRSREARFTNLTTAWGHTIRNKTRDGLLALA